MKDRYSDYDPFAWLYAHYWGRDFHDQILNVLECLVLKRLPRGATVLDLCCGDGRVAAALVQRGFRVTGVDGSEEMLSYARRRVRGAEFVLADARTFTMDATFDAVISTFDSLNHVMSDRDLRRVFKRVSKVLRPSGCFAFDLNNQRAYEELWCNMSGTVEENAVSVARGTYDARRRLAACDITLFRREGAGWLRSDFRLTQRRHSHEAVVRSLEAADFGQIAAFDAAQDLGMRGSIGQHRTFYLARRC
jgi:SAM-dependent methyltransferase